jgi:hypothetical protein
LRDALSPLREREFRLLFLGRTISFLGSAMAPVALAFAVLELTGSKTDLGLVLAARSIPQIVLLLAGGVLADRLSRHHMMVASNIVSGGAQAAVAALLLTGAAEVWHLAALAAVNASPPRSSSPRRRVSCRRRCKPRPCRTRTRCSGWASTPPRSRVLRSADFSSRRRAPASPSPPTLAPTGSLR